jgi:hypothetical protein
MLRVWMIASITMLFAGTSACSRPPYPTGVWTGVIENEPVVFYLPKQPDQKGVMAVLAIEEGPEWSPPEGIANKWNPLFPPKIRETEGDGKRPFLALAWFTPLDQDKVPIGQRVRVHGYMYVFTLKGQEQGHPAYNFLIERIAGRGAEERDTNEHMIAVEKIEVLGPGPKRTLTFEHP